jgi:hypothetical protein
MQATVHTIWSFSASYDDCFAVKRLCSNKQHVPQEVETLLSLNPAGHAPTSFEDEDDDQYGTRTIFWFAP